MVGMWHCNVKSVKSIELATVAELIRKCLKIPKELLREGASGVQTLYMTGRMQINQEQARDSDSSGSY
jgi:hypothetical protein